MHRYNLLNRSIFILKQYQIKKEGKDQESIQSSTTLDPEYQWERDNVTIRHHKREPRGQQVTTRHQQTDLHESITKQDRNNINDPQKEATPWNDQLKYFTGGLKPV